MTGLLESARDSLTALEADTPKLQALLQQHAETLEAANQTARADHSKFDVAVKVKSQLSTVQSMLEQHKDEIAQTRARVRTLEADALRTSKLERIRDATRTYRLAQAKQKAIFDLAEVAIVAGEALANTGQLAFGQAMQLVNEIDPSHVGDLFLEAVADTEIMAFPYWGEQLETWPNSLTHPALSGLNTGFVRSECVLDPADVALE
jgi:hypothetical protein